MGDALGTIRKSPCLYSIGPNVVSSVPRPEWTKNTIVAEWCSKKPSIGAPGAVTFIAAVALATMRAMPRYTSRAGSAGAMPSTWWIPPSGRSGDSHSGAQASSWRLSPASQLVGGYRW